MLLFTSHLTNNLHVSWGCGFIQAHGIIILKFIQTDKLQKRSQDAQTNLKQLKNHTIIQLSYFCAFSILYLFSLFR